MPEEALKVSSGAPLRPRKRAFTGLRGDPVYPLQHEKFTSGLQLSKKPSKGETAACKPSSKTPSKTQKSPGGGGSPRPGQTTADGLSPPPKTADAHKAEEKVGGEHEREPRDREIGRGLLEENKWHARLLGSSSVVAGGVNSQLSGILQESRFILERHLLK